MSKGTTSVFQLTLDGEIIKEFDSIKEAATQVGVDGSKISECCRGSQCTSGGYRWRYSGKSFRFAMKKMESPDLISMPTSVVASNKSKGITYYDTPRFLLTKIYERQKSSNVYRGHGDMPYTHDEFVLRYLNDTDLLRLFDLWKAGGCKKQDIPSFDRPDVSRGYSFDNIRVTTWSQNREKGKSEQFITQGTSVYQIDSSGKIIREFISISQATKATGVSGSAIIKCCNNKGRLSGGFYWAYSGKFRLKRDREMGNYGHFLSEREKSIPLIIHDFV